MRKYTVYYKGHEILITEKQNDFMKCTEYSFMISFGSSTPIFDTDNDAIIRAKQVIDVSINVINTEE